jgi:hypothetical protein
MNKAGKGGLLYAEKNVETTGKVPAMKLLHSLPSSSSSFITHHPLSICSQPSNP